MAAVASGTRLGVYEVIGAIGAGGMGTVYRARDTRLPREAAIKVSAEKFTENVLGGAATASKCFYASLSAPGVQAVDVDTSKGFQAGTPRRLFGAPPPIVGVNWTMSPDDKRFLFITTPNGGKTAPFTVMLNWAAGLKK
jgi:serine/threonine protein kinase